MRRKQIPLLESEGHEEPILNLMPLLDVVFVLLITLLLISPFLNVDHVELAPSGVLSKSDVSKSPLAITLKANDTLLWQGSPVTVGALKIHLQEAKKVHPKGVPQLIADKHCHFGTYQEVKNLLEESGFEQMDVILQ
jgi:biopolymer transport protein ExbD